MRFMMTAVNLRNPNALSLNWVRTWQSLSCCIHFYIWDFFFFFFTASHRAISFLWTSPENSCGNCSVARRSVGIARIASLILIEWAAVFSALSKKKNLSASLFISLIAAFAPTLGRENPNVRRKLQEHGVGFSRDWTGSGWSRFRLFWKRWREKRLDEITAELHKKFYQQRLKSDEKDFGVWNFVVGKSG